MSLEALMAALRSGDDGCVADERVVDSWVRDQVRLELIQIDVQGAIEAEGRGDRGDDLSDKAVQVLERWARDVKIAAADIVDGLVVHQERAVRVFDRGVRAQDGVVGLDDSRGDAGCGVDSEFELGFLTVVGGEALEQEGAKARAGSSTEGVEDQEALEGGAVVLEWSALPDRGSHSLTKTRRILSNVPSKISLPIV